MWHSCLASAIIFGSPMIPTALGNIVGGSIFVVTAYWYLYLTGDVSAHFGVNKGSVDTAMEAGGKHSTCMSNQNCSCRKLCRPDANTMEGGSQARVSTIDGSELGHPRRPGRQSSGAQGTELKGQTSHAMFHVAKKSSRLDADNNVYPPGDIGMT